MRAALFRPIYFKRKKNKYIFPSAVLRRAFNPQRVSSFLHQRDAEGFFFLFFLFFAPARTSRARIPPCSDVKLCYQTKPAFVLGFLPLFIRSL